MWLVRPRNGCPAISLNVRLTTRVSASSSSAMAAFSAGRCTNTHLLKHTQSQIYDKSTDNRRLPTLRGVRVLASIALLLLMLHADSVSFHSTFNSVTVLQCCPVGCPLSRVQLLGSRAPFPNGKQLTLVDCRIGPVLPSHDWALSQQTVHQ